MSALAEGMNFPRAVILFSFLASAALGYFEYDLSGRLDELRTQEEQQAPPKVNAIQQKALQLTELQRQLEDEPLAGQSTPGTYVREIAQNENVRLGQADVTPGNPDSLGGGVVDKKYTIKPVDKERGWSKENIGNFMYMLESKSEQVKVTRLKIFPPSKVKVKPHEIPRDQWSYEVEITSRQRE